MFLNKGLALDGGVLYVDGDLTIEQGVNGYGAVFRTGNMQGPGGSDLGSDSLWALVAGKDLTLKGKRSGYDSVSDFFHCPAVDFGA